MKKYGLGAAGLILLLLVTVLLPGGTAWTQEKTVDTVQVAKVTLQKHKDVIVQVTLVLKTKTIYGGRQVGTSEQKVEINGTVVGPSGLTIISNTQTDPSSMYSIDLGEDQPSYKQETSVTDVRVTLADGKEYPAKLVLRDRELDLAFVHPEKQGLNLPYLKLNAPPAPEILDEIIALTRLDRSANREPGVSLGRIMSIIKKPRVRYIITTMLEPGCPVFDASGNLLGLALMRVSGIKRTQIFNYLSMIPAVLPCSEIIEVMKQVPAPKEEK